MNTNTTTTTIATFDRTDTDRARTAKAKKYHEKIHKLDLSSRTHHAETNKAIERLVKRNGQYAREYLISVDGKNMIDKIADDITANTSYRVNIDYNKKKLTLKTVENNKLIARVYISANHYRISNYMNGTKVKQTANSFEELLEKIA